MDPVWKRQQKTAAGRILSCALREPGLVDELDLDPSELTAGLIRNSYQWIRTHRPTDSTAVFLDSGLDQARLNQIMDDYWIARDAVERQVDILREGNRRERLIQGAADLQLDLRAGESVNDALQKLAACDTGSRSDDVVRIRDVMRGLMDDLEAVQTGQKERCVPTGLAQLDGFAPLPGELVVVAGGTSVGKSELLLTIAGHLARRGTGTLVFSLEMTPQQCGQRILSRTSRLSSDVFRSQRMSEGDWTRLTAAVGDTYQMPIHVSMRNDPASIVSIAKRLHRREGIGAVMIDYLQLVNVGKQERRDLALGDAMQQFLHLAQQTGMVVYVGSQLRRPDSRRKDQTPTLSDLRDSGNIEQSAHAVWLLVRPEPPGDAMSVIVAKNRNGRCGDKELRFRDGHIFD